MRSGPTNRLSGGLSEAVSLRPKRSLVSAADVTIAADASPDTTREVACSAVGLSVAGAGAP